MIRVEGSRKRHFEEGKSGMMNELTFPAIPRSQLTDEPIILEGIIKGNQVQRTLVDGGSSLEIMYEHYFRNLDVNILSRLRRCKASMTGHVSPSEGRRRASIFNGISVQMFPPISKRIQPNKKGERGRRKVWVSYRRRSILFHPHAERIKKNSAATLQRMMEKVLTDQRGWNVEIYLEEIVIKSKITEEGLRVDPGRIQAIIKSLTLRSLNQIRSLFLQLTAISKFIPKLAELKHPLREARTRMETTKGPGWTNKAEEAVQRINRKLGKLPTLAILKEGSDLIRPLQGMEICYTPTEKRVQAQIHTARSLITVFRKHKVKVVTDGPKEETLKLSGREGRLGKWATEIRTYDISYVQRKEVEGPVIRKFFGKEAIEEVSGIEIIMVSPKEKMYSYAIRLKFKASSYAMDCEALLARLAAFANQGMKDLHVFIDSLTLVGQVEDNHMPATEHERMYKKGNYGCNGPIPQVLNHISPKNLKPKSISVNRVENYKPGIPQTGSIGRYQNKTINRRNKQQQERENNKQCTRNKTKMQL
ncbi:hypothetical protein Tco_0319151 [Tanacetum coccineum]